MDGVVRDVNARVLVGRGLMLKDQGPNDWRVNQLLYADDTVLLGDSKENIQRLLNEFDKVCENVGKSKVMVCDKSQRGEQLKVAGAINMNGV